MKYGLCVNHAPGVDRLSGIWHAEDLKKIGYDYIEVPTNIMNMLSEADFAEAKRILSGSGLPCRTCNDFMPMTVPGWKRERSFFIPARLHRSRLLTE